MPSCQFGGKVCQIWQPSPQRKRNGVAMAKGCAGVRGDIEVRFTEAGVFGLIQLISVLIHYNHSGLFVKRKCLLEKGLAEWARGVYSRWESLTNDTVMCPPVGIMMWAVTSQAVQGWAQRVFPSPGRLERGGKPVFKTGWVPDNLWETNGRTQHWAGPWRV